MLHALLLLIWVLSISHFSWWNRSQYIRVIFHFTFLQCLIYQFADLRHVPLYDLRKCIKLDLFTDNCASFFSLHLRNNLYANSIGEFAWARSLMWFNAYLWQGWFCIICFFRGYVGIITPFFFLHTIHFIKLRKIYILCTLKQVELSHPNAELRLLEVFYHKIYKVINLQLKLVWLMGILVRWWF